MPTSPTAPETHFDYLDGWRGLAIISLLLGHFFPVPGINFGTVGVNLFFVLSGYLMGGLLFVKNTPIALFYKRRFSRIFPAHACFIVVTTLVYLATQRTVNWGEVVAALLFVNNYFLGEIGNNTMPFGHIWSLSVEEHSYILLSVLAVIARRSGISAKWLIGSFALIFSAMGLLYWTRYTGKKLNFDKWLHSEVSAYGIFVSAFLLLALATVKLPKLPFFAVPALVLGGVLLHWWSVPSPVRTTLGVGLFALAVNLLGSAPHQVKRVLSVKPLRMMGLWSFSIYLWQQPFYLAAGQGQLPAPLALALAFVAGVASYYGLERPTRQYLNRVWAKN